VLGNSLNHVFISLELFEARMILLAGIKMAIIGSLDELMM
jgi:hypothetical protein